MKYTEKVKLLNTFGRHILMDFRPLDSEQIKSLIKRKRNGIVLMCELLDYRLSEYVGYQRPQKKNGCQ